MSVIKQASPASNRSGDHRDAVAMRWLRAAAPLLIVLSIWWPEFTHFRIDRTAPTPYVVNLLTTTPSANDLRRIADIDFSVPLGIPEARRPDVARLIMDGSLEAPALLTAPQTLRGWPEDLTQGGPTFQLAMASLAVEDLLLREYEHSGQHAYYLRACDRILAFARWEALQRKPVAMLWNDHAVAARSAVLTRLWRTMREDPGASSEQRAALVALIARSAELLAKPSQFTVRTNHGVMQNLALLQISAAFSKLPKAPYWRKLAMERLDLQLGFYVSDEGVVLEHSAGYHMFGDRLIGYALQLARLNGVAPSERLLTAARQLPRFTQHLSRPDGSLPLVGNTAAEEDFLPVPHGGALPVVSADHGLIYPLSGYAIWWAAGSALSQTLVAWAKHDHHGHKHADEPSVHFWSRGVDWITAAGYWPYGERYFDQANGWSGSNAPHAMGEPAQSTRSVQLRGSGEVGTMRAIDIENTRLSGLTVRRQVVQLSAEQILVLDVVRGATSPVETLWTLDPRLTLKAMGGLRFRSSPGAGGHALQIDLAHDRGGGFQTTQRHGSGAPFAGWVVVGRAPTPAPGLLVRREAGDSLTVVLLAVNRQFEAAMMTLADGFQVENWTIHIPDPTGTKHVRRRGAQIELISAQDVSRLTLAPPPDLASRQHTLRVAMSRAIERYPQWRNLDKYQKRVYMAIAVLWTFVELVLAGLSSRGLRRAWMDVAILAGWAAVAWWTHARYLV